MLICKHLICKRRMLLCWNLGLQGRNRRDSGDSDNQSDMDRHRRNGLDEVEDDSAATSIVSVVIDSERFSSHFPQHKTPPGKFKGEGLERKVVIKAPWPTIYSSGKREKERERERDRERERERERDREKRKSRQNDITHQWPHAPYNWPSSPGNTTLASLNSWTVNGFLWSAFSKSFASCCRPLSNWSVCFPARRILRMSRKKLSRSFATSLSMDARQSVESAALTAE